MPSSNVNIIPHIIEPIFKLQPESVLDIGCGFGKYGFLLREYLDISQKRYLRKDWKTRIDAVEIFEDYISDVQRLIYSNIFIGNINKLIDKLPDYDVILLLGVIEHLTRSDGCELVERLKMKYNKLLFISTPEVFRKQGAFMGNIDEVHKTLWSYADFGGARLIHSSRFMLVCYEK